MPAPEVYGGRNGQIYLEGRLRRVKPVKRLMQVPPERRRAPTSCTHDPDRAARLESRYAHVCRNAPACLRKWSAAHFSLKGSGALPGSINHAAIAASVRRRSSPC